MKPLIIFSLFLLFSLNSKSQKASDLKGTWMGYYVCGQGTTGVRITIDEVKKNKFSGTFEFFPHYSNYTKDVGLGVTKVTGEFYSKDKILINLTEWIYNPYNYGLVNIRTSMSSDGSYMEGKMLNNSLV